MYICQFWPHAVFPLSSSCRPGYAPSLVRVAQLLLAPLLTDRETVFFSNAAGRVVFHTSGFVRLAWSAERITLPELQAFYEQTLQLLRSVGVGRILSDHGQRPPLPAPAQQWLISDWIPRAVQAGVRLCAIVEGHDPMHRLSTQGVVSSAPEGMRFGRFHDRSAAEAWLLQQIG